MPPPIKVELLPHCSSWAITATEESQRLLQALGENITAIHHIGSTAIPDIHAKPIIDLLPVVRSTSELDDKVPIFRQLGYQFWGEYGIPGRRYCTLDDPLNGRRKFQLHCFEIGNAEIERHLAFRDYLRAKPIIAKVYDREKQRCRELHPEDSHAYSDAKAGWIARTLVEALAFVRSSN